MVFVSVDAQGHSTPVRELVPRTLGEELEQQWAARAPTCAVEVEAAMAGQVYTDAGRHLASSCASSRPRPTSTGAARSTAAS